MAASTEPLAPSSVVSGRYQIHRLLGQGGMSRVYLATDLRLNVQVAIKENLQTAPEAREQFIREAQILARLSHPSLPRVFDHLEDTVTERQYLVMDFIEGQDLNVMVKRVGHLPEATAVAWIRQVLDALEYLHSQNPPVIHRDIKPSNIKITPAGKAVLVDFGLAKTIEGEGLTMTGARSVTPGYAPPEQYGMRTDVRSDIYALGATLYTLLTGRVPPESTLRTSNIATLVPPHLVTPEISSEIEAAILCAMDVDTQRRWQSATAFKAALSPAPAPSVDGGAKTTVAGPDFKPFTPPALDKTMPAADKPTARPDLDKTIIGPSGTPEAMPRSEAKPERGQASTQPTSLPEVRATSRSAAELPGVLTPPVTGVPVAPSRARSPGLPLLRILGILLGIAILVGVGWVGYELLKPAKVVVVVPYPTDTPTTLPTAPSNDLDGTATAQFLALALPTATSTAPPPATLTTVPSFTPVRATNTLLAPTTPKPTTIVLLATATRPRPTATKIPPTAVPAPTFTLVPQGPPTVAVVGIRLDPADTHRNQQVTFYVTFRNTFTTSQQRRWAVKIYQEDNFRNSFGETNPSTVDLPVGDSEWPTLNTWCPCGPGDQMNLYARVAFVAADKSFTFAPNLDGNLNSFPFVVKP